MPDLFDASTRSDPPSSPAVRPLADRIRPVRMGDVIGQGKVLGPDGPLGSMLASRSLSSLILWGPPGVGKTTIARLLAEAPDGALVLVDQHAAHERLTHEALRAQLLDGGVRSQPLLLPAVVDMSPPDAARLLAEAEALARLTQTEVKA